MASLRVLDGGMGVAQPLDAGPRRTALEPDGGNMKRLALTLAATLLGTGCIITDNDLDPVPVHRGSVLLYWDFQKHTQFGAVPLDDELTGAAGVCPESAVDSVTIDTPNGAYDLDCRKWNASEGLGVQGVIIDELPVGLQSFRVRGWRGDLAAYDLSVSLDVYANTVTEHGVLTVPGKPRPLEMFAYLAYGNPAVSVDYQSCAAAGTPNIAYEIYFGPTLVAEHVAGCSDPLPALVFQEDLDVDYGYEVRMQGLSLSNGAVVFDSCYVEFDHLATELGVDGFAATLRTLPVPSCQ
jgi:hypothetical protein